MNIDRRYWFAATPFGTGWWRPCHWLGWTCVALTIALAFVASRLFPPDGAPVPFWVSIGVVATGFLLVCRLKGEPLSKRDA